MKQFTIQAIALACITGATISSAKPIRARPWSSKYGADLTNSQGFGSRELSQEEAALLARAAQVNFHTPNTGHSSPSQPSPKSASYSRSAAEVGNKARKLRRKSSRLERASIDQANDEHHPHNGATTHPSHSTTTVTETHRNTEIEAQPRECVADLEARFSPLSVFTLVNQLRRLKGHLTKVGHHNETVPVAAPTAPPIDGTTITNGNDDQPEQRDLDEDDILFIRAFSEALDSLD